MGGQKTYEILVIVLANALSHPYTVMVKFWHTDITQGAVFRSWRSNLKKKLCNFACFTLIIFAIYQLIIIRLKLFYIQIFVFFCDNARRN